MSEEKSIDLTEKEKQDILLYQNTINNELYSLGNIRRKFLSDEARILEKIAHIESEFMNKLKFIFQSKEVSESMEGWAFDPTTLKFMKTK